MQACGVFYWLVKRETGDAGSWKLEAGSWKLEAGSWKLEAFYSSHKKSPTITGRAFCRFRLFACSAWQKSSLLRASCPRPIGPASGCHNSLRANYSIILATTPAPTVRPPSRIAKRRPSSIAIG
ncbi:hypothetical protein GAY96_01070 [Venatoribacter cucullus]|nr:hypothetical protein GAY96_01070 [Venatoribacter cucullus]